MSDHDKEWIIGCIKHDGFIKTDRFDKANHIILDALEKDIDAEIARLSRPTDYISRADAIEAVASEITEEHSVMNCGLDMAIKIIKALPSADAVPIVYCMDCAKSVPLDEHGALWKCKAHDRTTLRHSYCNNGERKGGDTE